MRRLIISIPCLLFGLQRAVYTLLSWWGASSWMQLESAGAPLGNRRRAQADDRLSMVKPRNQQDEQSNECEFQYLQTDGCGLAGSLKFDLVLRGE